MAGVAKVLYNQGFKNQTTYVQAIGSDGNGKDGDVDCVYAYSEGTLYYSKGRDYSWSHALTGGTVKEQVFYIW